MDYCEIDEEGCPLHAECKLHGPADYKCVCVHPYVMKNLECHLPPPISKEPIPQHNKQPIIGDHKQSHGKFLK